MEESLIKTIEEKIEELEQTENQRIDEMEKEQKIDVAYEKLKKQKEECLTEIRNNGAGSREASVDLEKIEAELEKLKNLEKEIVKNVEKEISDAKGNLLEVKEIINKKENAQKNKEIAEKNIEKLTEYKEECLAEIRSHGIGSKEASADLERIEAELEGNIKTKEENEKIIEESNKKINDFAKMYEIKEIMKEQTEDKQEDIIENQEENKIEEDKEEKQENKKEDIIKENVKYNNSNIKTKQTTNFNKGKSYALSETNSTQKDISKQNKIILNIDKNEININGKEKSFYKNERKNKKDIIDRYGINHYFIKDGKKKNIDYALISTLEKIAERQDDNQGTLVKAYLNIIKGGNIGEHNLEESMKILRDSVDIEYKFDKDTGIFANWKEKRIARNAKKLGIASLDGISEKSIFDKMKDEFSKVKSIKLLKDKEQTKTLGEGQKTNAQIQKEKLIDVIDIDRKETGLRKDSSTMTYSKVKKDEFYKNIYVDIRNNRVESDEIEKSADQVANQTLNQTRIDVNEMMEHDDK